MVVQLLTTFVTIGAISSTMAAASSASDPFYVEFALAGHGVAAEASFKVKVINLKTRRGMWLMCDVYSYLFLQGRMPCGPARSNV